MISARVQYSIRTWPFLGPKRRAFEALRRPIAQRLSPEGFLDHLATRLPDCHRQLELVHFYEFRQQGLPDDTAHIAVLLVGPSPRVRDRLFELRHEITAATGWYPLVQGSRADSPYHEQVEQFRKTGAPPEPGPVGTILRVEAVFDSSDEGSCFRVVGTKGSWLLDTGMKPSGHSPSDLTGIVLTHSHSDHAGGVYALAQSASAPIFLSEGTLTALWHQSHLAPDQTVGLLKKSRLCLGNETLSFADGSVAEFFPTFHAPGSMGIRLVDESANVLVYFGDLCLRNGFHTYADEALAAVLKGEARSRTVILDASMAGRPVQEIDADEGNPDLILHQAAEGVLKRNVVFVGVQPESLVYTFLRAFYLTQGKGDRAIRFLVSDDLYQLIRALYRPVQRRKESAIDPLAKRLVGKMMTSNFAETHRLYPLRPEVLAELPEKEPVVILTQPSDLDAIDGLAKRLDRANIYLSGTMALRDDLPPVLTAAKANIIKRVASADWGFHSTQQDLVDFIRRLTDQGVRVGLFHGFPRNLTRFIDRNGLDPRLVTVMASSPIELGVSSPL